MFETYKRTTPADKERQLQITAGVLVAVNAVTLVVLLLQPDRGFSDWLVMAGLEALLLVFGVGVGWGGAGIFAGLAALGVLGLADHVTDASGGIFLGCVVVMAAAGFIGGGYVHRLGELEARTRGDAARAAANAAMRQLRRQGICPECRQPASREASRCPHCTSRIEPA